MSETKQREFISLTDVNQFEEEMLIDGYRGDKDANAQRAPLPHDNYLFRVRYADNWPAGEGENPIPLAGDPDARWITGQARDGKTYWMTWLYVETANNADPQFDGYSWTEILTTYPTKQGTTAAQALLQGFEVDTIMLNTHRGQVKALDEKLAGDGTMVGAEVDWVARQFDKNAPKVDKQGKPVMKDGQQQMGVETFRLRGMRRFPKNEDGSFRFTLDSADFDKITEEIRAFNEIRRWVPASRLTSAEAGPDLAPALQQSIAQAQAKQPVQQATPAQAAAPAGNSQQQNPAQAAQAAQAPRAAAGPRSPVRRVPNGA